MKDQDTVLVECGLNLGIERIRGRIVQVDAGNSRGKKGMKLVDFDAHGGPPCFVER